MYRKIALFLSVLFQPLMMPTLVFGVLLYAVPEATNIPYQMKGSLWLMVSVTTLFIPMLSVMGLQYMGSIPSIHMAVKKDRYLPFGMVSLFYVIITYFFYAKLNFDDLTVFSLITMTGTVILLTIVTFFWKVSAHMTGLSGVLAIIIILSWKYPGSSLLYPLLGTIMTCGLVASARLYLQAHRPGEILAGFCLGFSVCFIAFYYYLLT